MQSAVRGRARPRQATPRRRNPSEWTYVPVRRFVAHLEESVAPGTQWVVFGHNAERPTRPGHRQQVWLSSAGPEGAILTAHRLAKRLGLDLWSIDLARVVDKYIGETEKNLRSVFSAADRHGAILLFDEADALFGKRTDVKDAHDRYAEAAPAIRRLLAGHHGIVILASSGVPPSRTRPRKPRRKRLR